MIRFNVYDEELIFSEDECNYKEVINRYLSRANTACADFMDFYKSSSKDVPGAFLKEIRNKCSSIVESNLDMLLKDLIECKIYTYSKERLVAEYETKIFGNWVKNIKKLEQTLQNIVEEGNKEIQYRNLRKETRGRWEGGGFGVGGALKGAATAGVFNGVTGAGHTMVNAIGNASTRNRTRSKAEALVNNSKYFAEIGFNIFLMVKGLGNIFAHIANKEIGKHIEEYPDNIIIEHDRIFDNLLSVDDIKERKNLIVKLIKMYPYDRRQYELAISEFGDPDGYI